MNSWLLVVSWRNTLYSHFRSCFLGTRLQRWKAVRLNFGELPDHWSEVSRYINISYISPKLLQVWNLIAKLNFHTKVLGISQWDTGLGHSCNMSIDETKTKTLLRRILTWSAFLTNSFIILIRKRKKEDFAGRKRSKLCSDVCIHRCVLVDTRT